MNQLLSIWRMSSGSPATKAQARDLSLSLPNRDASRRSSATRLVWTDTVTRLVTLHYATLSSRTVHRPRKDPQQRQPTAPPSLYQSSSGHTQPAASTPQTHLLLGVLVSHLLHRRGLKACRLIPTSLATPQHPVHHCHRTRGSASSQTCLPYCLDSL